MIHQSAAYGECNAVVGRVISRRWPWQIQVPPDFCGWNVHLELAALCLLQKHSQKQQSGASISQKSHRSCIPRGCTALRYLVEYTIKGLGFEGCVL